MAKADKWPTPVGSTAGEKRLCPPPFSGSFVLSWQGIGGSVVLASSCS
jgi:hypothetical protein